MSKMEWNCRNDGCHLETCRPPIEQLCKKFPRGITPTDIDYLTEMNGNFLFVEWKPRPLSLKYGQRRALQMLSLLPEFTVLLVAGQANTLGVTHIADIMNGSIGPWKDSTRQDLERRFKEWADWADRNFQGKPA